MRTIPLEQYQYTIISELLSEKNAFGNVTSKLDDGRTISFSYDYTNEYNLLRNKLKKLNPPLFEAEDNDIHDIVYDLHILETQLLKATNTPAIRNESYEKLRLVCKTIDYLDSFVEYVE